MKLPIIINEAGKIYIEAVPQLAWGKGKECTFIGALESALAVTPTPNSYENLMGWSALAFRSRWYHGDTGRRWCPSSPVGEFPEELAALRRATGLELPMASRLEQPNATMEDFAIRIAMEIRAGRPLLAYEPQLNMGVIFGFEDEGLILLMRDYMTDDPVLRLPIEKLGPFICFLGRREAPLSPQAALLEGVRLGVENWHRGSTPAELGRYWLGRAALVKWRDDLHRTVELPPMSLKLLFFVNWWTFDGLADARSAAERFLRNNEAHLAGSARRHLLAAAALFAEEAQLFRHTLKDKQAFLGPWSNQGMEQWTDATRERETAILNRALAVEADAMGELENLLDAAEVPVPLPEAIASS